MRPGLVVLALAVCGPAAARAQDVAVEPYFSNLTRLEGWSYFDPPPSAPGGGPGDPDYWFPANRATLGVRVRGARISVEGAFQYTQLANLPLDAFGPGALGGGALYAFHAGNDLAFQLYLKRLNLTARSASGTVALTVGRMAFASGGESDSGVPAIEAVKRMRLHDRLVGSFDWSQFERAFDGVRLDVRRPGWHVTGAALLPAQGGFEESATPTMEQVRVGTVSVTKRPDGPAGQPAEWQVFAYLYDDHRAVAARPDNTGLRASSVDVTIVTAGASHVGIYPTVRGEADSLVWGAVQGGSWYGQRHRAWSLAIEGGHRWSGAPGRPWVRAGVMQASGDGNGLDDRHTTFFPMLPTARRYALSITYTSMNLRDVFAQVLVEPHPRVRTRLDVRRVDLATPADRWYAGSGATQARSAFFGYATRPSAGATHFGAVVEGSADVRVTRRWSLNGYLGVVRGGDVVSRQFAGRVLRFGYVESVFRLP
ncbi:MAG: alginate export family protein [Acidobacteriota bacterium]